ncbi:Uncharacterised protein [Vibrio cholerae]|nr:Uncharacterised protein [Vibrio cholerae]
MLSRKTRMISLKLAIPEASSSAPGCLESSKRPIFGYNQSA